jgi:NADPH-dependent 2,4-dienoyl-CoA reductase/sulfur reductase-like enzyme
VVGTSAQTIVVAGGSLAGHTVVAELARRGFPGEVVWVRGAERAAPYSKPALSKELMQGRVTPEEITLPAVPDGLRLRVRDELCLRLDPDADRVLVGPPGGERSGDGEWIRFDALFVCTGMRPRTPPGFAGLPGVHCLRTLADALRIRERVRGHGRPRTVVVGAGLIGSEIAASLRTCGLPVELVEQAPLPMAHLFGAELARFCRDRHHEHGVVTRMPATVTGLHPDGDATVLTFDDGTETTADLVVLGLGAVPATEWLEGAGLDLSDGVGCDAALRTARPNVFAAGDVARWPNPVFGRTMRVEHWMNASAQARHAVESWAAGQEGREPPPFADVPYFWSDQYGLKFQMVGYARDHDEVRVETAGADGHPFATYHREGRLVAAAGVNAPRAVLRMKARIQAEAAAEPVPVTEGVRK